MNTILKNNQEDFEILPNINPAYKDLNLDPTKYNIHTILTTYCPIGCQGCYQTELTQKKTLDPEIAWIKIKETIQHINKIHQQRQKNPTVQRHKINLTFFGGEPLLQIQTILYILSRIKSEKDHDYMNPGIWSICIPTSGFANTIKKNPLIENAKAIAELVKATGIDCNISISHDGPDQKKLRNTNPVKTNALINQMKILSAEYKWNLISDRISTVIPQEFDEDYFINTYKYITKNTGLQPSFTFPHTIYPISTFIKNPEIFQRGIRKFTEQYKDLFLWWGKDINQLKKNDSCCSLENTITGAVELPTLFEGVLSKLYANYSNPNEVPYNWCSAGVNHFTIKTDGSRTNCEILNTKTEDYLQIMNDTCYSCAIKRFCQKPCIKNFEPGIINETSLRAQCQSRKILFNEVRRILS